MVRMTDLVRGRTAGPPARTPSPPPPAPPSDAAEPQETKSASTSAPTPPPAAPSKDTVSTRPARLNLRSLAGSLAARPPIASEPAAPAASDIGAADEIFNRLLMVLEHARGLVKSPEPFPWSELERVLERAASTMGQSAELFWIANTPLAPTGTDALAFHQARVSILGLRVAQNVELTPAAQLQVAMAGALIDVGLWQLGEGGRKIDAQSGDYRTHPRVSAEIVRRWGPPQPSIVEAIAQHHELEQGQGYPQGLRGDAIHAHAKILALVDRYAGLTGSGGARGRARPHEAIRDIVRSKNEEFSPALIKAFLGEISVFPPGTPVRLNTGELARVTGVNRNHPLRPRVEALSDAKGNPITARIIDLADAPFVYITGPATESA